MHRVYFSAYISKKCEPDHRQSPPFWSMLGVVDRRVNQRYCRYTEQEKLAAKGQRSTYHAIDRIRVLRHHSLADQAPV
jgi:hypothetical protein